MAAMRDGGHKSADSCRMAEVESVGTVELVCVGRLLRMGCDPFLMSVCECHGNILLRTNGREGRQRQKAQFCNRGRGEVETENLIMWIVVLELLASRW